MSQDTFESRFNRELDLLNENRLTMGLKKISQARIAEIIIYDKDISFASKKSLLNQYVKGVKDIPSRYLRMMRKLFLCSIDDLLPIGIDINELPTIEF